jgi:hypothetical protein
MISDKLNTNDPEIVINSDEFQLKKQKNPFLVKYDRIGENYGYKF